MCLDGMNTSATKCNIKVQDDFEKEQTHINVYNVYCTYFIMFQNGSVFAPCKSWGCQISPGIWLPVRWSHWPPWCLTALSNLNLLSKLCVGKPRTFIEESNEIFWTSESCMTCPWLAHDFNSFDLDKNCKKCIDSKFNKIISFGRPFPSRCRAWLVNEGALPGHNAAGGPIHGSLKVTKKWLSG